jgi:hypothetical protein
MSGFEMTREDIENIALTKKGVEDLTGEVQEIKGLLKNQYAKCMEHFAVQDGEIQKLKECASTQKAVQTWKDAIFNKTTAVVIFIIAFVDAAIRFSPWGK